MVCVVHASSVHRTCIAHASISRREWRGVAHALPMHCSCIYPGGFAAKMMEARRLALVEGTVTCHVTPVCAVGPPTHTGPRELNSLTSLYYLLLLTSIFFSLRPDLTLKMKPNIF